MQNKFDFLSSDTGLDGEEFSVPSNLKSKDKNALFGAYFQRLDKKIKDVGLKISESTSKNIELLGIFVALFTFISVDIQIFKSPLSLTGTVGFIFILLGSLLVFCGFLHMIFASNLIKWKFVTIISMAVLLIAIGAYFLLTYNNATYRIYSQEEFNKDINQRLVSGENAERELKDFKECLAAGEWVKCLR